VRKLQISLPDFRRLCIFKGNEYTTRYRGSFADDLSLVSGIYPREPRNKRKASKSSTPLTTFYYTKDIQYLLHEPLLNKFREHKALSKKIARSLGRGEVGDAARLEKTGAPKISLDHIIKERYPTFVDALRDLDDALSMLFLFANLPSTSTVPPKTIALCQRLCLEFQHYLITTNSLRKSFLSIKGIYYQATIQGQDILWLVPYRFVQRVTGDVDFRIMGTFVEFYTTLLGFVNFRLYTSIGLIYPPKFNASSDEKGGELGAFTLEGRGVTAAQPQLEAPESHENGATNGLSITSTDIQAQADTLGDLPQPEEEQAGNEDEGREEVNDAIDAFETTGPDADVLPQPQSSSVEVSNLFAPYTFFLSRETPRQPLEFLLRAFGCKRIGWDTVSGDGAFTHNEADTTITHQVVDRPSLPQDALPVMPDAEKEAGNVVPAQSLCPGGRIPGRTYIQPQWVWDCVNQGKLLRPDLYAPGATLPPHLSPWVKPTKGAYDPAAPLAEQEREGEAEEALDDEDDEVVSDDEIETEPATTDTKALQARVESPASGEMTIASSDDDDDDDDSAPDNDATNDEFTGFDSLVSSEDEAETVRSQHQRELEAEAAGLSFSGSTTLDGPGKDGGDGNTMGKKGEEARKKAARRRREEEEELERQKMMMSRKKRKVLEKMLFSNRKRDEEAERLRGKRRRIERGVGKAAGME